MDLDCRAEGYPAISFTWLRNGFKILNDQYYKISNTPTAENITDSSLSIHIKEKRLYGDYICRASNDVGADKATINLYETAKETCSPDCNEQSNCFKVIFIFSIRNHCHYIV